jgi:hypothetical protein
MWVRGDYNLFLTHRWRSIAPARAGGQARAELSSWAETGELVKEGADGMLALRQENERLQGRLAKTAAQLRKLEGAAAGQQQQPGAVSGKHADYKRLHKELTEFLDIIPSS